MKFIATTIVLLASTAVYAGESKLRLGRDLQRKGNRPVRPNGDRNKNPNGFNGGYGKRCCRDFDNSDICGEFEGSGVIERTIDIEGTLTDFEACNTDGVTNEDEFETGFPGCTWHDDKCSVCAEATDGCEADTECCSGLVCDTNSTSTTYQTCIEYLPN